MKTKKQFGLKGLLGVIALLAASHSIYWKSNEVPWHRGNSDQELYNFHTEKRNLWGETYKCNTVKFGKPDQTMIDAIQIEHIPSQLYFWAGKSVESHERDQMQCHYPSCNPEKPNANHDHLRKWIEDAETKLEEYVKAHK